MFSIALQAGGKSSRMGQDKALLLFNQKPLIQRIIDRLSVISTHIYLTTDDVSRYSFLSVPTHRDLYPGYGALGGVVTALHYAEEDVVAIIACDMPFINPNLVKAEVELLNEGGYDVVIPKSKNGLEPLHAVYRKASCLPAALEALRNHKKRVISWFPSVNIREMTFEEIVIFDPCLRSFKNVNTPAEFRLAEELARSID